MEKVGSDETDVLLEEFCEKRVASEEDVGCVLIAVDFRFDHLHESGAQSALFETNAKQHICGRFQVCKITGHIVEDVSVVDVGQQLDGMVPCVSEGDTASNANSLRR